jgi:hypothetical protein
MHLLPSCSDPLVPHVSTSAPDLAVVPSSLKKLAANATLFTTCAGFQTSPVLASAACFNRQQSFGGTCWSTY